VQKTKIVPTPYAELVTQVGQQKIVDALTVEVLYGHLTRQAADMLIEARNWDGALIVLRRLNQEKHMPTN